MIYFKVCIRGQQLPSSFVGIQFRQHLFKFWLSSCLQPSPQGGLCNYNPMGIVSMWALVYRVKGQQLNPTRVWGVQQPLVFWIIFHLWPWMCSFPGCLGESLFYPAGAPGSFPSFQGQLDRFSFTRYKEREKDNSMQVNHLILMPFYSHIILFSSLCHLLTCPLSRNSSWFPKWETFRFWSSSLFKH